MAFYCSRADITIYGGAAGGGKTYGLLIDPLRFVVPGMKSHTPGFKAVYMRRTYPRISAEGGLWDESKEIYGLLGGDPKAGNFRWEWPNDVRIRFSHLGTTESLYGWHGAQIPFIAFDQLEEFEEEQFWFMLARNRTAIPVKPWIKATANPRPGWLADLLQWWWDPETGYAIKERSGKVRWFVRLMDQIHWADDPDSLMREFGDRMVEGARPKSMSFIPASVYDNKVLMKSDPGYVSNLQAMSHVEQERLIHGNWKIVHTTGNVFPQKEWVYEDSTPGAAWRVRYWDEASLDEAGDYTAGVKMAWKDGEIYVEDVVRGQWATRERDRIQRETAELDARDRNPNGEANTTIQIHQQEPGSSGKDRARAFVKLMAGFPVKVDRPSGSKPVRADPYSAQQQGGNVILVRGPWNRAFVFEHSNFPATGVNDDQVDAASGAFSMLQKIVDNIKRSGSRGSRKGFARYT